MRYGKILIVIIVAIFMISLLVIVINRQHESVQQQSNITMNKETINNKMTINKTVENISTDNYNIYIPENVCEGCHLSGKSSIPQATKIGIHNNAGAYCIVCHIFSHQTHPMTPTNKNVTCEKCHEGKSPTKPIFTNGSIVCNNCHNYPDPLMPSYGNILTIHRSRNVSCIKCHTDTCTKCHTTIGTTEKWTKRLTHFGTMLNTLRTGNLRTGNMAID